MPLTRALANPGVLPRHLGRVCPHDRIALHAASPLAAYNSLTSVRLAFTRADKEQINCNASLRTARTLPLHIKPSRKSRKAQKQTPSALVQEAIHDTAQGIYAPIPPRTGGASKSGVGSKSRRHAASRRRATSGPALPLSLYTIVARYLAHITEPGAVTLNYSFTSTESAHLEAKGFDNKDIGRWASSLSIRSSTRASECFLPGNPLPPLFVVLLFLRRKVISKPALMVMMRHIDSRLQLESLSWTSLKVLVKRLVRHVRMKWPETTPWIAAVFTTEASRIYEASSNNEDGNHRLLADLTHFCNAFMDLLARPLPEHPILSSIHQQSAQFQILRFMASCSPALVVTRTGFRATVKTQLAHSKTAQEQEWAILKGPSWPPWKHNRTAMDEDKGYEFAASRASRIMHRMFEAGYDEQKWEKIAEIYAGWDTDLSPTIQTRTLLPELSTILKKSNNVEGLLWAGRVRTTRTRREAWACFLASEGSGTIHRQEVYLAMFEKLYYQEAGQPAGGVNSASSPPHTEIEKMLLPGDAKEVLPEPGSPIDLLYLAEPVPSFEQLYHRMVEKGIRPANRLLAFLVETSTEFSAGVELLRAAKDDFNGQIQRLLDASIFQSSSDQRLPGRLVATFVRFLCRFGRFAHPPATRHVLPLPEDHHRRFTHDRHYLLDYAYALLITFRPQYRPAWTAYMEKLLFSRWDSSIFRGAEKITAQYTIMSELCQIMQEEDIDLDDEQFKLVCTVVRSAAQVAFRGLLPPDDMHRIITSGSRQLRSIFQSLVGTHVDQTRDDMKNRDGPRYHIPGPAVLHAYVRALGCLRDYKGLYSFSTWTVSHVKEITARANAQHGGPRAWRRTLIALRAGLEGVLQEGGTEAASEDLIALVKAQIEGVEEWGQWPSESEVELYAKFKYRNALK